jgi:hypothetical protein
VLITIKLKQAQTTKYKKTIAKTELDQQILNISILPWQQQMMSAEPLIYYRTPAK